ncbi:hypothetical protein RHGRI_013670 [Rhododendron griersonianum]|uniref:ZF-HD dimerization-type domain-containing protein n=1 Tax=Rhododendron griersonianum TaxID=479676 RepID=A0AAV6K6E6_9ERIC|nr:hypothetical protein RHGRI_013670 [Rhododendron griersonianum]
MENINANGRRWAKMVIYRECRRNHFTQGGHYVVDGCMEFMKAGEDTSPEALICAACRCHRNYHRREDVSVAVDPVTNHHLLHHMATAPALPTHVLVLGSPVVSHYVVPVAPPPPPPEENLNDGEVVEEAESMTGEGSIGG